MQDTLEDFLTGLHKVDIRRIEIPLDDFSTTPLTLVFEEPTAAKSYQIQNTIIRLRDKFPLEDDFLITQLAASLTLLVEIKGKATSGSGKPMTELDLFCALATNKTNPHIFQYVMTVLQEEFPVHFGNLVATDEELLELARELGINKVANFTDSELKQIRNLYQKKIALGSYSWQKTGMVDAPKKSRTRKQSTGTS